MSQVKVLKTQGDWAMAHPNIFHNKELNNNNIILWSISKFNSDNLLSYHFIVFTGGIYSTTQVSRFVGWN